MEKIKKKNKVGKLSVSRKIFIVCNTVLLLLFSFAFLAPYINILAKSFNSAKDTMLGGVTFFPRVFTLDNYDIVLKDPNIGHSALISVIRVISPGLKLTLQNIKFLSETPDSQSQTSSTLL